MKIAIVCGHFMPEIGYQEIHLAKAYARANHEVMVFTSTEVSTTGDKIIRQPYAPGITQDEKYNFTINRLNAVVKLNSKVVGKNLKEEVKKFNPDCVIILALAKLFPAALLSSDMQSKNLIAVFGDSEEYMDRSTTKKRIKAIFHSTISSGLKKYLYTKAVKYCTRLVLNIPETDYFIRSLLSEKNKTVFDKKKLKLNLGFDPDEFYFDTETRNSLRKKLNISDDACVLITSTRINRRKHLEKIIENISTLNEQGINVHYILIGFLGDDYEKELKKFIAGQKHPEIFHCFPFLSHDLIRGYYSAADAGLWLKAAISIQEAMGTGLPVVLEYKDVVSHLLQPEVNGWYFEKNNLPVIMKQAATTISNMLPQARITKRKETQKSNAEKFSYDVIAREIINFN